MSLYDDFEDASTKIQIEIEKFFLKHFGPRCPDYEAECLCCQKYRLLDELFENPYDQGD